MVCPQASRISAVGRAIRALLFVQAILGAVDV